MLYMLVIGYMFLVAVFLSVQVYLIWTHFGRVFELALANAMTVLVLWYLVMVA